MANHSVTVAKASLIAPFVRPDPTSIPRDEVTAFHGYLETALDRCSPSNIQKCRAWLSANATSSNRITAVAKYLGILSASFPTDGADQKPGSKTTSSKRKKLHILYLINDWLHAGHHHQSNGNLEGQALSEALRPHLLNLVVLAAACDLKKNQRLKRRIDELLQYWQARKYYDTAFLETISEATLNAEQTLDESTMSGSTVKRDADSTAPFNLPAQHGDVAAPWHELPAANMLPLISPNSSFPVDAELVKPIRFNAGPADSSLVALVQDLVRESEVLYGEIDLEQDGIEVDFDELGQKIMTSKDSGDVSYGETYYGWSKEFCERMKRKQREGLPNSDDHRRSRSVSRGRYSSSVSRSRSRSRSRSGRRPDRPAFRRHSHSSSPGRSRSPKRSFRRAGQHSRSPSRSQMRFRAEAREKSYSPPDPTSAPRNSAQSMNFSAPQHPLPQAMFNNINPSFIPPPPPIPFSSPQPGSNYSQAQFPPPMPPHLAHFPPGGVPTPPPRPPNWQGPWPPPPPPPPPPGQPGAPFFGHQGGYQQFPPGGQPGWNQFHNAGQGPPPPPPPGGWGGPCGQRWG